MTQWYSSAYWVEHVSPIFAQIRPIGVGVFVGVLVGVLVGALVGALVGVLVGVDVATWARATLADPESPDAIVGVKVASAVVAVGWTGSAVAVA